MKKIKNKLYLRSFIVIITLIIFFIIIDFIIPPFKIIKDRKEFGCPDEVLGNKNANLSVKYFYTPYCVWCWVEEPILERLVEKNGDAFKLERYDLRYCKNEVIKYKVSGVPYFVFSMNNGTKEFKYSGFATEAQLKATICILSKC